MVPPRELGTNYSVGFSSAGQNLPGDFEEANPEKRLADYCRRKPALRKCPPVTRYMADHLLNHEL
jgi:hypothetical protein